MIIVVISVMMLEYFHTQEGSAQRKRKNKVELKWTCGEVKLSFSLSICICLARFFDACRDGCKWRE